MRKRNSFLPSTVLTAGAASALAALPLLAQTPAPQTEDDTVLEEVISTAQRRAQNVQDIPLAVSAFSEAEMDRRQITEALDLVRMVPNLVGHNNTGPGNSNAYFLRGLGNTESIATFDPPVGTYVDDVYISRQSANNYALFDIERIEVLRGPQGTLFGRNTTGGAVNVITKKPGTQLGGMFELGYGEFDKQMVRGSVDVPFSDKVLSKFSGFWQEQDGFVRSNVTGEENNDLEGYGGRVALRFLPNERLTWDVAGEFAFNDQLNMVRRCLPNPTTGAPSGTCAFGADADSNNTGFTQGGSTGDLLADARAGRGLGSETETMFLVSNLTFDLEALSLSFITGYRDEAWEFIIDFVPVGMAGVSGFAISNDQDTEQFTQEIKAVGNFGGDKWRYTAGLFYIDEDNRTDFQDVSGASVLIDRVMSNGTESIAGYLQLDYNLTEQLTLTAGGRYTEEEKNIAYTSRSDRGGLFDISTAELIAGGVPVEQDVSEFTPKVAVEYRANEDWLLYASATNGFKSGGWNARGSAPHTAASYLPFGPEEVWSYETGFKSQLMEDRMRLNVNLFWAEVEELQLISGVTNPAGGVLFLTQNSGEARFRGAEFEWQWFPADALNLYGSIGLMDAEYTEIKPQPASQITLDTQPVRAPDVTGNLGAIYTIPVSGLGGSMRLGAELSFTGTHWVASSNTPAFAYVPRRWLYQAQLGYDSDNGRWAAALSCKNCTDEDYETSWFVGPYYGDPMTWDLRLTFRFE